MFSVGLKIKGDALAVGRPRRRSMESGVERELQETGTVRINRADLHGRSVEKVERNLVAFGRPVATLAGHCQKLNFM